ncbi:MAG: Ni/Fe hydrogenase subunit alpha [Gammaproteobacteria bacterium]|nr:Ni/Fe hydrogenase subunit alpha [Gammaproteobacteria bacterium]
MSDKKIRIKVPALTRVEGEGSLDLHIDDGKITKLRLNIFEPPRLFEKFLEGRHYSEVPDIVARICGICPVAYQMSAVTALESLFEVDPGPWVKAMRRLFYCGEWIESHALHIHLLAAPDFLGYESAPAMAQDYPEQVRRGIRLQHAGNAILKLLGGRSVHPVGVRVGGFHAAPALKDVEQLLQQLRTALVEAQALLRWVANLPMPDNVQNFLQVATASAQEYPMIGDAIVTSNGDTLDMDAFEQNFQESHEPHSTALFCRFQDQAYLVGPLARVNLHRQYFSSELQQAITDTGITFPSNNMYHSIIARAVEIQFALMEAIQILESYQVPASPFVEVETRAGVGYGGSEAPRGLLWHRYEVDDAGLIVNARIVPPTSQNQARIEEDLHFSIAHFGLDKGEEELRRHAEQVIRNYDPCISCATHFLDLRIHK